VGTVPKPPRIRWVPIVAIVVVAVAVFAVAVGIEVTQTSSTPPSRTYLSTPFPPLWTTSLPKNSAFGGVFSDVAYYTVVPLSTGSGINYFQCEIVAFDLQSGSVLWKSEPISVWGAGNVDPELTLGPRAVYLVGYAANLTSAGAPWNGTNGVFAIGFNPNSGAQGPYATLLASPTFGVNEVAISNGSVYTEYIASGAAVLQAFSLPGDPQGVPHPWVYNLTVPAGGSSNVAISVEGGYELVTLPSAIAVLNAASGAFLENIPASDPLDLFDGAVMNGTAFGISWIGADLYLQGFHLATGAPVLNESIGPGMGSCGPYSVKLLGTVLFASTDCGAVWSAYDVAGSLLWTSTTFGPSEPFGYPPVPIAPDEVLIYSYPFGSSPPSTGNATFQEWFTLYNRTTGAVVWQEAPWFEVAANATLLLNPSGWLEPPSPTIEASSSDYVVVWWDGLTAVELL